MGSKNKSNSRSNTPRNNHNQNSRMTPKSSRRSQTPNHKHKHHPSPSPLAVTTELTATEVSTATAATPSSTTNNNNNNNNINNLSPATKQAFEDALEDVHTRFILNLPEEELSSSDRLFFQIEQAWWFYEDFICDEMDQQQQEKETEKISYATILTQTKNENENDPIEYPRFTNLKPFARQIFQISPILSPILSSFDSLWKEFTRYKRKISTYGTILLNTNCTKLILCQDYGSGGWTFPAGKVNQNEKGIDAAARETYEETGFDILCSVGKTGGDYYKQEEEDDNYDDDDHERKYRNIKYEEGEDYDEYMDDQQNKKQKSRNTWRQLSEEHSLVYIENDGSGKRRTCFICHGVPEDFPFAPVVRKEVSDVSWHDFDDLPKKTFAVLPFMKGLRKWLKKNRRNLSRSQHGGKSEKKRDASKKKGIKNKRTGSKGRNSQCRSRNSKCGDSSIVTSEDDDLVQSGLGRIGEVNRWSEDDMFRTNEELIGRKIEYDGNPQQFATKGFDGIDPHAYRIVGGGFMNSGEKKIAKAPDKSIMQPLHRRDEGESHDGDDSHSGNDNDEEEGGLKPFFSDDGSTPWGEKVFSDHGNYHNDNQKKKQKKIDQSPRSECSISESSMPSAAAFEDYLLNESSHKSNSYNNNRKNEKTTVSAVQNANDSEPKSDSKKKSGLAILTMLRRGGQDNDDDDDSDDDAKQNLDSRIFSRERGVIPASEPLCQISSKIIGGDDDVDQEDFFMTDRDITAKSERNKRGAFAEKKLLKKEKAVKTNREDTGVPVHKSPLVVLVRDESSSKTRTTIGENENLSYLRNWVTQLPKSKPTKQFGDFRFDVDAIMMAVMKAK